VAKRKKEMSWEETLKAEELAAARKQGRKNANNADTSYRRGHISGICNAAGYFVGKGRMDIAKALLQYFCIDREKAADALEHDKRVKDLTLSYLDKHKVWDIVVLDDDGIR